MKTVATLCVLAAAASAHATEACYLVGWPRDSGKWAYYQATVTQDRHSLEIHYDHDHGVMSLVNRGRADGLDRDVSIFVGTWREEHGRGGKVTLLIDKSRPIASGFYTNSPTGKEHIALVFGDCAHLGPG